MPSPMRTTDELADFLGVTKYTVNHWRYHGIGPRGIRIGKRVMYRDSDIEEWLERKAAEDPAALRALAPLVVRSSPRSSRPQSQGRSRTRQGAHTPSSSTAGPLND